MEINHETCFSINGQPQIVVLAANLDIGFVEMPFVRVRQCERRLDCFSNCLEDGCKALDPARDGDMGDFDLMTAQQQLRCLPGGDIGHEEVVENQEDDVQRMAHALHGEQLEGQG